MSFLGKKPFSRLKNLFSHTPQSTLDADNPIAIIGLAGRYPGVKNLEDFWEKLKIGWDGITEIPANRWDWREYYVPGNAGRNLIDKSCSKWGGFLSDVDKFDSMFFNISPKQAVKIVPEARLTLEVVWELLENSGYTPEKLRQQTNGAVGVFVGNTWNDYRLLCGILGKAPECTFSSTAVIPNGISYFFNLHGPSVAVDTLCSSSLTAIHLACDSIKRGECPCAIVGGVNLTLHYSKYLLLNALGFLSTNGRCNSFGAEGDGFVPAEGIGLAMLKPLKQAQADGDNILAVIRGTAINHCGKTNQYTIMKSLAKMLKTKTHENKKTDEAAADRQIQTGITVPNPVAQAEVIRQALKNANLTPEQINYVEAHGTGTQLGDPIEMVGLCKAFEKRTTPKKCPLGAVKSNVGHMEAASGMASVTKVIQQLQHKQVVPSIHAKKLNPLIDFERTPFYLQQELSDWSVLPGELRRAGISSFGATGTNGHVIIEQAPEKETLPIQQKPYYLLTFSAKQEESLQKRMSDLHEWLVQQPSLTSLANIAYTLNARRAHFSEYRSAIIVSSIEEAINTLMEIKSNQKPENYLQQRKQKMQKTTANEVLKILLEKMKTTSLPAAIYHELLIAVGDFYVQGHDIDWNALYKGESHQFVMLPNYPFLKKSYWCSADAGKETKNVMPDAPRPLPTKKVRLSEVEAELQQPPEHVPQMMTKPEISSPPPIAQDNLSPNITESVHEAIKKIISETLFIDVKLIHDTEPLQDLGVDSILGVEIAKKISQKFNVEINTTMLYTYSTIAQLTQFVTQQANTSSASTDQTGVMQYQNVSMTISPWFQTALLARPDVDLFCFPCAGGGPALFNGWRPALQKNIGLHLIELPGREKRIHEPLETNAQTLVENIAHAIIDAQLKRYVFFSHSMGALLAFYVAKYLQQQGVNLPEVIFLSSFPDPTKGMQLLQTDEKNRLSDQAVLDKLNELGINGIPPEVSHDVEASKIYLNILRADMNLQFNTPWFDQLLASERLPSNFVIMAGENDRFISLAEMESWKEYTSGSFFKKAFPGNHFYLTTDKEAVCHFIGNIIATLPNA